MTKDGFVRVAAAKPEVKPGNVDFNLDNILKMVRKAEEEHVELIVFPELSLTGYTCADLFFQTNLQDKALRAVATIARALRSSRIVVVVGLPIAINNALYNCAAVIKQNALLGIVPKSYLPNYGEFYEQRWFKSGINLDEEVSITYKNSPFEVESLNGKIAPGQVFNHSGFKFGVEICEDLWVPNPPAVEMAQSGADIIVNLSATDEIAGKHKYLLALVEQQSARCRCGYIYSSAGTGESSTDLAFSGNCIIAENGTILCESERFVLSPQMEIADIDVEALRTDRIRHNTFGQPFNSGKSHSTCHSNFIDEEDWTGELHIDTSSDPVKMEEIPFEPLKYRFINPTPFVEKNEARLRERCEEISSIQAWGLAQRLRAINCSKAVIGISGGLDSTLALLVTVKAFDMLGLDRKGIIGITMPGFGTTNRTHDNAWNLMEELGVTPMEIPINKAVQIHFEDIGQNPEKHDATYENSQARERTQILMDMANKTGGIVIGTGDLSELALGWCTYNGDQMSMYGVNASIPKTLVRDLVRGYMLSENNEKVKATLQDIIDTPISPELLPAAADGTIAQKTEDFVGPYELHDFFLHSMLRHSFSPTKIFNLASKAFEGVYDKPTIKKWLVTFYRRFFSQQFKRSCMPDGVKVGSVCLSPRGDWRMPSDASAALWINEAEALDC